MGDEEEGRDPSGLFAAVMVGGASVWVLNEAARPRHSRGTKESQAGDGRTRPSVEIFQTSLYNLFFLFPFLSSVRGSDGNQRNEITRLD